MKIQVERKLKLLVHSIRDLLSKMKVAKKLLCYFKEEHPKNNEIIEIIADDAVVNGVLVIKVTGNLTSLEFHYQTVSWNSGLMELYKKPKNSAAKRKS